MDSGGKPNGSGSGTSCGGLSQLVIFYVHLDKTWYCIANCKNKFELAWSETQTVYLFLKAKKAQYLGLESGNVRENFLALRVPIRLVGHSSSNMNHSFAISIKVYNYNHSLECTQQRRTFLGQFRKTSADLHWERNAVWKNDQWFTDCVSYSLKKNKGRRLKTQFWTTSKMLIGTAVWVRRRGSGRSRKWETDFKDGRARTRSALAKGFTS